MDGTRHYIILYVNILYICRSHAKLIAKATGCKASYALMKLPHHDRVTQTVPDAMHTIKDCIEKIVYLITGKEL